MTSLSFTSGWQVNELYGLEDEAFGPLLVASDAEVSEVNRRGALSDAIDAVNTADPADPAAQWAALQVVALMRQGLTPLDQASAEVVENWLVEGDIGDPLPMQARNFGDLEDPAVMSGVLAAVIAFEAEAVAIDAWADQHVLGAAQLDVVAAHLWLAGAEDDHIAEQVATFVDVLGDLLDDWARWSVAHRLHHVDFPADRILDQLRAADDPGYADAVRTCVEHPYGQQAAALSLTEDPNPQAASTLRQLVLVGVPAAPIGLVANLADRFDVSLARAVVPASEGAPRSFVHTLVEAVLEYEMLDGGDEEESLLDVAADDTVPELIRGVVVGALVTNLMDLEQAHGMSDAVAGVSAQMDSLLGKLGVDRSQIPGMPDLPSIPDVAGQQARLNELGTSGVVAYIDGPAPDWFTGAWEDLYPVTAQEVAGEVEAPAQPENS